MMEIKSEPVIETSQESELDGLNQCVDDISLQVNQLEEKLKEVEHFYASSTRKVGPSGRNEDREKFIANFKKRQQVAAQREAAAGKRMQELMNEFRTILDQLMEHKWAGPFMHPVDVVGLGLDDYHKIIKKPMDFSTVKRKMDTKDGSGYKSVREIYVDVRLIFKNAMKYNDGKVDVHVMAKTLMDKFETKWLQLLPKVDLEDKRRREEEADMEKDIQFAQEAAHAKMARDINSELNDVDMHLEELKQRVLQKCRKITTEEKKRMGRAITQFSPENISRALEIIAEDEPDFESAGETLEIDIDSLSESTLWKLKLFVKDTLLQSQLGNGGGANNNSGDSNNSRKREPPNVLQKKSRKARKIDIKR